MQQSNLIKDFVVIAISVIVAIIFIKLNILEEVLNTTKDFFFLNSFVAGLFLTSVFTTAPAIVALGKIAQLSQSVIPMTIFGGLGALCGNLITFYFIKDRLMRDVTYLINSSGNNKLKHIFKLKFFRWLTFFLGALIIVSPLPDELGLVMIGLSKTKNSLLIPVSFLFNLLGILIIGLVAKNFFSG